MNISMPNVCPHQEEVEIARRSQLVSCELRCGLFREKTCPLRGESYLGCQRFSRWFWEEFLKLASHDFSEGLEVEMQVRE